MVVKITKAAILDLLRKGEITPSRGAELLGMNYHDFVDLMNKNDIPLWNYTAEMLKNNRENRVRVFKKIREEKDKAIHDDS